MIQKKTHKHGNIEKFTRANNNRNRIVRKLRRRAKVRRGTSARIETGKIKRKIENKVSRKVESPWGRRFVAARGKQVGARRNPGRETSVFKNLSVCRFSQTTFDFRRYVCILGYVLRM